MPSISVHHEHESRDDQPFLGYRVGSHEYHLIEGGLFIAAFVTFGQLYAIQVLLPKISDYFSIPPVTASLAVSMTTAALAVALFFAGPLSERIGRRPVIVGSIIATSLVGMLIGFAPVWPVLLAGRILQGFMLAGLAAVAAAYLAEEIHPLDLPRSTGLYVAGTGLGGLAGRLASGLLSNFVSWNWTLSIIGTVGLVMALIAWRMLPKQRGFVRTGATISVMYHNMGRIMREPALVLLFVTAALALGAYQAIFNMTPYRLTGEPYLLATWMVSGIYLVNLAGSWSAMAAGSLAGRFGRRTVLPISGLLALAGILITLASPLWLILVGILIFAIGFFGIQSVAAGFVASRARSGVGAVGQASSLYSVSYYAGGSLFGTLAGVAWSATGWGGVALLCATLVLALIGVSMLLRRIPPLTPDGR